MGTETHRLQEDPAEGSRSTIDRQLERQENRRESGARKPDDRRKKDAGDSGEDGKERTDRPGVDLGGAEDRTGGSAVSPKGPVEKGRGETGRASGFSDLSGSRPLGNRGGTG